MAAIKKLRGYLRQKKGSSAVEFIATAALLILVFAVLVSAMVYVTEYYSASYICRRVVRTIEVSGEYDENVVRSLVDELGGDALDELSITVDADYCGNNRIQLRDEFRVQLDASYTINILMLGDSPLQIKLPIHVGLSGRSEVFWK